MCKQLLFDMLLNTKYLSVKNITIILIELMYMYIVLVPTYVFIRQRQIQIVTRNNRN
jgi:hypothetical protein